jgi:hypothetical protein
MMGGDYNACQIPFIHHIFESNFIFQTGLVGCSRATACALATSFLATDLYDAVANFSNEMSLQDFLVDWRKSLQNELRNDPHKILGRTNPTLASTIPIDFPDPAVLQLYVHPVTSQSSTSFRPKWIVPRLPCTKTLTILFNRVLGWDSNILYQLVAHVWGGLFIRGLIQVFLFFLLLPTYMDDKISVNNSAKTDCCLPQQQINSVYYQMRLQDS